LLIAAIPLLVLAAWFTYLWSISGVLPAVEKYPNGRLKSAGYVKRVGLADYRRHGRWITYHSNGQKQSEGLYELGEQKGTWTYWDEKGARLPPQPAP